MYFEKRRRDWKLGRWTAKQAVRCCLELSQRAPSAVEIIAAPDGAPEAFLDGKPAPLSISISHSARMALCVVSKMGIRLGCDLEEVRSQEAGFAADYFTSGELALVDRAGPGDRDLFVMLIWSAKESVLKALRHGLRRDTRSVEVCVPAASGVGWRPLSALDLEASHTFHGWWRTREGLVHTIAADVPSKLPVEIIPDISRVPLG